MRTCSTCHVENPDDSKFCANCGSPLATATETREERKVVTVLFADLVGFTSRSEQLDPEDVRATLTPYFARLRDELERRGGTVEKFIGDAVMAITTPLRLASVRGLFPHQPSGDPLRC